MPPWDYTISPWDYIVFANVDDNSSKIWINNEQLCHYCINLDVYGPLCLKSTLTYLFTCLVECTLKQDLTQKPLHRYRRVLALLSRPKVL